MTYLLLGILFAIAISLAAVLLAAESALSYLPRSEAERLGRGRHGASIQRILAHPHSHLHGVRFLRIFFEMSAATAVAFIAVELIESLWIAGLVTTVVMAALSFVIVGVSPRQFGRAHSSAVVVATAPTVSFLCRLLGPIPRWLADAGRKLAGESAPVDDAFFTEEEFREFVDRASDADYIEDEEAELIHSVFDLGDTLVAGVMVPRTDMITIHREEPLEKAVRLFVRSGFSRIPVINESADDVVGMLYFKDVAARLHGPHRGGGSHVDPASLTAEDVAREARYVPDSMQAAELLRQLQRESIHVAIVVDEYGGTAGLVTLEDVLEEIVGEIVDEYDAKDIVPVPTEDGGWEVPARMSLDDLGDLVGAEIEDDDVETAGGLLAKALGRVPIVGSRGEILGLDLVATRSEGRRNRISHLVVHYRPSHEAATEEDA
ncbi:hemolysin family protein [Falsarthrobacter nasiphocae]|uniref:CBS domain containing-hemolysin-like protein n=1 Tax=Falsarthrobacter nasiphocae TaxID=189863 RepID=A0AAE3YDB9_9MICC|nr:hemolysin family protein [Falsarthrobacter nasiphocae]MDR6891075.1 CBS domain containing-hemolysin-like protein [Falsarthrobacter nasiphocae]